MRYVVIYNVAKSFFEFLKARMNKDVFVKEIKMNTKHVSFLKLSAEKISSTKKIL